MRFEESTTSLSHREVSAITRGWSDIDPLKWFTYLGLSGVGYAIVFHPTYLASARQYTHQDGHLPIRHFLRESYRDTGLRGFYRGFAAQTAASLMSEFTYMGTVEVAREFLPFQEPFVRDTVAGGLADFAACIFYTPLGLIANRQMTAGYGLCSEKYGYASIRDNARTIYTQRGLQGFFVGFVPMLLTVPGSGIWWGLYGFGKRHLYAQHDTLMWLYGSTASRLPKCFTSSKENALLNGLSGSVAGALVCVVQNPLWVIKARMQIMNVPPRGALMFVVKDLMKKEGLSGFYKGMVFNATVFALECGLFSILYDLWKELATKEAVAPDL